MNVLINVCELFNYHNLRWFFLFAGTAGLISGIAVGIGSDMARNGKGHVPPDPPVHATRVRAPFDQDAA